EKVFDFQAEMKRLVRKECCTDDAPARLRDWVRQLATEKPPARDREAEAGRMIVDLALAFLAGLLSFASTCVLPLVPAYVTYMGAAAAGTTMTLRQQLP